MVCGECGGNCDPECGKHPGPNCTPSCESFCEIEGHPRGCQYSETIYGAWTIAAGCPLKHEDVAKRLAWNLMSSLTEGSLLRGVRQI